MSSSRFPTTFDPVECPRLEKTMTGPSMRISVGASLSSLGVPHAAATAMEYAANAYSCPRGARSSIATRQQAPGQRGAEQVFQRLLKLVLNGRPQ